MSGDECACGTKARETEVYVPPFLPSNRLSWLARRPPSENYRHGWPTGYSATLGRAGRPASERIGAARSLRAPLVGECSYRGKSRYDGRQRKDLIETLGSNCIQEGQPAIRY